MKKSEASTLFGISPTTIDLWLKRQAAIGSVAPQDTAMPRRVRGVMTLDPAQSCLFSESCPRDWVVFDNATFHLGGRIAELIESAGCEVVYLPPYSPDLNRIEKDWGWLKSRIRKALSQDAS